MFLIARSAVCIGIVVATLPAKGRDSLRDLGASVGRAASAQVLPLFDRAEPRRWRHLDPAGRFDLSRLAVPLGRRDDRKGGEASDIGDRGLPGSVFAMLKPAKPD